MLLSLFFLLSRLGGSRDSRGATRDARTGEAIDEVIAFHRAVWEEAMLGHDVLEAVATKSHIDKVRFAFPDSLDIIAAGAALVPDSKILDDLKQDLGWERLECWSLSYGD